ncbi:DUF3114 domain-containing protein [Streptococcus halichoeri]|uniref:DUF3114 domain-containing protein n=1 Tax=Streptococcus halichoeri TaxID=254785 RepID=UPI0019173111
MEMIVAAKKERALLTGIEERYKKLVFLASIGWKKADLALFAEQEDIDYRIGSPVFLAFWQQHYLLDDGKALLQMIMTLVAMPKEDLSGELQQTQAILRHFHPELAPDAPFWSEFALLVNRTYPGQTLAQAGTLERQLHQFRYIISSQQAQYVRSHFKKAQMTDRRALIHYLRKKKGGWLAGKKRDYSVFESARLHNKLAFKDGQAIFPDARVAYNIKLLMHFHTEFILSSEGHFLNEVDAEKVTQGGVVNGASFNYGTRGQRHWDLDVDPVYRHDPAFRKQMTKGFRSPKRLHRWAHRSSADFAWSYFSHRGFYARKGRSSYYWVQKAACVFQVKLLCAKLRHSWPLCRENESD